MIYYSRDYEEDGTEDYRLLVLSSPIGTKTGYFALHAIPESSMKGRKVNAVGYPEDKTLKASTEPWYELWGVSTRVKRIDKQDGTIYNSINSAIGQSGNGVFYLAKNQRYYFMGVHLQAGESTVYANTCATWISESRYILISAWMKDSSSKLARSPLNHGYSQVVEIDLKDKKISDSQ